LQSYEEQVQERLRAAARNRMTTLREFAIAARGAFPMDVALHLQTLDVKPHMERDTDGYRGPRYDPELHPLDGEWYFTGETAKRLSSLVQGTDVLCLGTPTVAVALATSGVDVVLVDRNIAVARRFRPLPSRLRLIVAEATTLVVRRAFDTVIFDAPWYEPEILSWMAAATNRVRPGGVVLFPLFPELLRPAAMAERARILASAEKYGTVTLEEGEVRYDTPLFETRALEAAGVVLDGPWRQADLVRLRVDALPVYKPSFQSSWECHSQDADWDTFVIGPQVVKLRRSAIASAHTHYLGHALGVIENLGGYDYASVSRREPNRSAIDLWTSRNRVAAVHEHALVKAALQSLSATWTLHPSTLAKSSQLSQRDAKELLELLELGRGSE
jgi:hypothetical protein